MVIPRAYPFWFDRKHPVTVDRENGKKQTTPAQRLGWEVCGGGYGIHWDSIDEDLSTAGMLKGAPAPTARDR
nr:DUF2442 domain-containing protein [Chamaesiphon sp. GL140_3_metabinner_50]